MTRYGFAVDVTKCTGCHNCFVTCKDEFDRNDYLPTAVAQPAGGQDWIRVKEVEHGSGWKVKVQYIPTMCQHCEDAPCMKVPEAPEGAVYRRADGLVIIDPVKAKGCKELVRSCPYQLIFWNEETNVAQKCTGCAHMLDGGEKTTRCAEACPTGALLFGDLEDAGSEISKYLAAKKDQVEFFKPEIGTKPAVRYIALPKPFIAGEILLSDQEGECAKGVKVTLTSAAGTVMETVTDFFGDFEFRNLEVNGAYTLKAAQAGYATAEVIVRSNASKNLGEIVLKKN